MAIENINLTQFAPNANEENRALNSIKTDEDYKKIVNNQLQGTMSQAELNDVISSSKSMLDVRENLKKRGFTPSEINRIVLIMQSPADIPKAARSGSTAAQFTADKMSVSHRHMDDILAADGVTFRISPITTSLRGMDFIGAITSALAKLGKLKQGIHAQDAEMMSKRLEVKKKITEERIEEMKKQNDITVKKVEEATKKMNEGFIGALIAIIIAIIIAAILVVLSAGTTAPLMAVAIAGLIGALVGGGLALANMISTMKSGKDIFEEDTSEDVGAARKEMKKEKLKEEKARENVSQTGKSWDDLTDKEKEAALKKAGVEIGNPSDEALSRVRLDSSEMKELRSRIKTINSDAKGRSDTKRQIAFWALLVFDVLTMVVGIGAARAAATAAAKTAQVAAQASAKAAAQAGSQASAQAAKSATAEAAKTATAAAAEAVENTTRSLAKDIAVQLSVFIGKTGMNESQTKGMTSMHSRDLINQGVSEEEAEKRAAAFSRGFMVAAMIIGIAGMLLNMSQTMSQKATEIAKESSSRARAFVAKIATGLQKLATVLTVAQSGMQIGNSIAELGRIDAREGLEKKLASSRIREMKLNMMRDQEDMLEGGLWKMMSESRQAINKLQEAFIGAFDANETAMNAITKQRI